MDATRTRLSTAIACATVATLLFSGPAFATKKPCLGNDKKDSMMQVGPLCVDAFEASAWSEKWGGTQYGAITDDYPCHDSGQDCTNIFARSVAGVTPSAFITWFQAQQACANAGKWLLTNAEWQVAAAGTSDSAAACNTNSGAIAATGALSGCVSNWGVHDMAGNVWEWVADWVPRSTTCPGWGAFSEDRMCLAGADTHGGPGALVRGGNFNFDTGSGVFAVDGLSEQFDAMTSLGFRCAR